jgi:predicted nucleic-acid-binding protein
MRAVDTNVLVRLITRDDSKQVAKADHWIDGGAWVSHLALAETSWVLSAVYDLTPVAIHQTVSMLLDHRHLTIQDPDVVAAALEQFKIKPALGFSDCLMLEIARKAGHLPLGTFDRGVARLDGAERVG